MGKVPENSRFVIKTTKKEYGFNTNISCMIWSYRGKCARLNT
jgi:hypothetical protein